MRNLIHRLFFDLDRLAVNHRGLAFVGNDLPWLLQFSGADDGGRNNRASGFECQTRRTGVAFIETSIRTAGAFDVDAEQVAVLNDFTGMVQRAQRLGATGTVHGKHANGCKPPFLELAFDAFTFEIFGFAHEMNHAWAGQWQQCIVDDGKMVGRNDGTAFARNVFKPFCGRPQTVDGDRS